MYTGDGNEGIYYHDGSGTYTNAAEEAGDNSYRYTGVDPNNYVCFGSDEAICPEDNLYRIIGVFEDNVKVVKATSYGEFESSSYTLSSFVGTEAYTALNETFYNSLDNNLQEMIIDYNWISDDMLSVSVSSLSLNKKKNYNVQFLAPETERPTIRSWNTAKNWFDTENNANHSLNIKIATFSISELRYSASPTNWVDDYLDIDTWLYLNENEATYLYYDFESAANTRNYIVGADGNLYTNSSYCLPYSTSTLACPFPAIIRPCFYLDRKVEYVSGDGSQNSPFRISM